MSATAVAPLGGAIPVFADITMRLCLDIEAVKENAIEPATIVTNLFGHPIKLRELRNLVILMVFISLKMQLSAPPKEGLAYSGTIGHIGVFSRIITSISILGKVVFV